MGQLDFGVPLPLGVALGNAVLFPVWLGLGARTGQFGERHGLRFAAAFCLTLATWLCCLAALPALRTLGGVLAALALLGGAGVFYLQVWGLLTRGYTLGILLTLLQQDRALTPDEIAKLYRGGDGLQWIMQHRLGGLEGAGMVRREGAALALAPRGVAVARIYGLCVAVLGLRRTG